MAELNDSSGMLTSPIRATLGTNTGHTRTSTLLWSRLERSFVNPCTSRIRGSHHGCVDRCGQDQSQLEDTTERPTRHASVLLPEPAQPTGGIREKRPGRASGVYTG